MSDTAKPFTALAFDFGEKSIGVAIGQSLSKTARPLTTIKAKNGQPQWSQIEQLLNEWQPKVLVVGIPQHIKQPDDDPKANRMIEAAERFARQLQGRFDCTVVTIDESLTTQTAKQELKEQGLSTDKASLDAYSAKLILEAWFFDQA